MGFGYDGERLPQQNNYFDPSQRKSVGHKDNEDYSLFSFLPNYESYKQRLNNITSDKRNALWMRVAFFCFLGALYIAYFVAVMVVHSQIKDDDYWCDGDGLLILLTTFVGIMMLYFLVIKPFFGKQIYRLVLKPIGDFWDRMPYVQYAVYAVLASGLLAFLIVDAWEEPERLISLFGLFVLLLLGFVFSYAPRKVVWRHVIWGVGLQFVLGLLILRWSVGKAVFECAGDKVATFLSYTDEGSTFVFGELVPDFGIFAFSVLPVVLFFSFCVQILYYYGIMQWVVIKMGWLLQVTVGTTACESVNAAANIFLGQTEAPLIIRPFLPLMTKSELHAVLTGGFATIAGSVMAAYISIGISAPHLLSASVMSAPAALAYAKLFYPETETSMTTVKDIPIEKGKEANALHAAIEGVVTAIPLVANIAANLITFIAFVAFFNGVFDWGCQLVNVEEGFCTLENISGYVFMPLAWSMGVKWDECHDVGTLIGLKTIVNEFVAYTELENMISKNILSPRAQIIATYALCGFSNISSIGIQLGGIGGLAPLRRADISKVIVRAMIAGSAACFMTGCVAGTLLNEASLGLATNETLPTTDLWTTSTISAAGWDRA